MARWEGGVILLLTIAACVSPSPEGPADTTWVGTITTEGNVTTVVNESGSVWGGTARLVEEASIGVKSGADEYMFGQIEAVYADDEAIYVVDSQVPAVRAYDQEGRYLRDYGAPGQGPGEYMRPMAVTVAPDGRVLVLDWNTQRINVYALGGDRLDEIYRFQGDLDWGRELLSFDSSGEPWLAYRAYDPSDRTFSYIIRAVGPDGPTGPSRRVPEIEFEEATVVGPNGRAHTLRWSPRFVWGLARSGTFAVGTSDRYRFAIHTLDGAITVVEKWWDKVPVVRGEAEWIRRTQILVSRAPAGWNGAEIPKHKPAFGGFRFAATGEIWVSRSGPSARSPDCVEARESVEELLSSEPCWRSSLLTDVFDSQGRFLGPVELPDDSRGRGDYPSIRWIAGDRIFATSVDEAGTIMVKRYRLVLPGER